MPVMARPPQPSFASDVPTILCACGALVCFLAVGLLGFRSAVATYGGSGSAESLGYAFGRTIGAYLVPALVAIAYHVIRREKPASIYTVLFVSLGALGFALVASASGIAGFGSKEAVNQHIVGLVKNNSGSSSGFGQGTKWDDAIRSFFTDIKSFNQEYTAEVGKLQLNAVKKMYEPSAIADSDSINEALTELRAIRDVDERFADIQPIIDRFKERVEAVSASEEEKADFEKGFQASAEQLLGPRKAVIDKERAWVAAAIDIFEFASANSGGYSVTNGKLNYSPSTSTFTNGYRDRVNKARQLQVEYLKAADDFKKVQTDSLKQLGLKPSDFDNPAH
jgi:hypothetical protein